MREILSPLDGIRSPFGARRGGIFSPAALFAASEPGGWYDPSDLTTLFQDASGTTPVTAVEQPVGLMLDKSRGLVLGPNIGPADAVGVSVGANITIVQTGSPLDGVRYKIQFTVVATSGGITAYFGNNGSAAASITQVGVGSGTYTAVAVTPAGETSQFLVRAGPSGFSGSVTNILIQEIAGNHLTQSTTTARPVLSARVNLLTKTEQFDDAVWNASGFRTLQITANSVTAPDGTLTADKAVEALAATGSVLQRVIFNDASTSALKKFSVYAKKAERKRIYLFVNGPDKGGWFDLDLGTCGAATDYPGGTASIQDAGSGWYRCTLEAGAASGSGSFIQIVVIRDTATTLDQRVGDGTSGVYIWGADLRVANDGVGLPPYQRVGAGTPGSSTGAGSADYTTTGFPLYLRFDGTDDFMVSPTITPGIDKAQVFAGVRKLSDAAFGPVAEYSADAYTTAGALYLAAPENTTLRYAAFSKGTAAGSLSLRADTGSVAAAPDSAVLASTHDIAGDLTVIRRNGVVGGSATADQGSGNFSNQALYVGRRGGTTLPFNGRVYGLTVRFGANLSATQITDMETWLNNKTKAF